MPAYYSDDNYAQAQAAAGSPDDYYYYSGRAPGQYTSGAIPVPPTSRLQFEPPESSSSNQYPNGRQVSPYQGRPRSLPPPARRKKSYRELTDASTLHDQDGPLDKARDLVDNTFTNSNTGLGVGVLGAIVGGLIAREASEATTHRPRRRGRHGSDKGPLVSTIVGAAVGGLAANALEKRFEVARVKTAEKEDSWERKWGRDSRGRKTGRDDDDFEDTGKRETRRRSSSMLYGDDANEQAVYARSGR
ncbi:hypothetical protein VMCG_04456 [Cytospora schulzeri]|uniref:Glycine zipper 2TM domain-containing protein n=1 Tax=Cytospora schulzeri TaxID=448051 RepID=A0A423WTB8_9PEZI|nr:hypothetical protein VMCG_04456 [Valsa malicola]